MCNLYSITTNQDAIRRLFEVVKDSTGNLQSLPAVFPDQEAPVVFRRALACTNIVENVISTVRRRSRSRLQ
jgi:hypothetical protein